MIEKLRVNFSLFAGLLWLLLVVSSHAAQAQSIVAAVLPNSRAVQVGSVVSAFGIIINTGSETARGCSVAPPERLREGFSYLPTDSTTNTLTGTPNTPFDIPAGSAQTFVIFLKPLEPFRDMKVRFKFNCSNTEKARSIRGVNDLWLSSTVDAGPDIVALAATSEKGVVRAAGPDGLGVFAVATYNLGASSSISVSADTDVASLPLTTTVCELDTVTGDCLAPPSPSLNTVASSGETQRFGVFVDTNGSIPFDPASHRIFLRFQDNSAVLSGATSVAVTTEGGTDTGGTDTGGTDTGGTDTGGTDTGGTDTGGTDTGSADFSTLCADSNVLFCQGFDTLPAERAAMTGEGIFVSGTTCDSAVWPKNCPSLDQGALKFTIPSQSGPGDAGQYYANFADLSGDAIQPGETVFVRWKQKFSADFLNTLFESDGRGWKQAIIGDPNDWSCSDNEIVVQNNAQRGFPQMYHACGLYEPFETSVPPYDFDLQPGGDTVCLYSKSNDGGGPDCFGYVAGEWMQFQIGIDYSTDGNDRIRLWAAREGDTAWTHLIDYTRNLVDVSGGYGKVWFLPYHTRKDSTQVHPEGYTWYDELIVSKAFVPLGKTTTTTGTGSTGTGTTGTGTTGTGTTGTGTTGTGTTGTGGTSSGNLDLLAQYIPAPGQWALVPNTELTSHPNRLTRAQADAIDPRIWETGVDCVIRCWNGAAWDAQNHRFYLFGGGHNGYSGNEVYRLDLENLSLTRLNNPSPLTGNVIGLNKEAVFGPAVPHTYDGTIYSPATNSIFVLADTGDGTAWEFDLTTNSWTNSFAAPSGIFPLADYDPLSNKIYVVGAGSNPIHLFDPATRRITQTFGSGGNYTYVDHSPAVLRGGKLYLLTDNPNKGTPHIRVLDPSTATASVHATFPSAQYIPGESGLAMRGNQFVIWGGEKKVWLYDEGTGQWTIYSPASGPSSTFHSGRVYSRWVYLPELDVFAGYANPGGLWLFKP